MPKTRGLKNYSNVHFTSSKVAKTIVEHFQPTLPCLEPCKGEGAFLEYLPKGTEWCEIEEGRDFFEYEGHVKWIVTNPPFDKLTDWMRQAFKVADNVVFVIPISKFFSSQPRMELAFNYGGIKEILCLGSGRTIGFDLGFPFGAIHFKRGYTGLTKMIRYKSES